MRRYVTTVLSGRLANVAFQIWDAFRTAILAGGSPDDVVIDGGYVGTASIDGKCPREPGFLLSRYGFFENVWRAVVEHKEYVRLVSGNRPVATGSDRESAREYSIGRPISVPWHLPVNEKDIGLLRSMYLTDHMLSVMGRMRKSLPENYVSVHVRRGDFRLPLSNGYFLQSDDEVRRRVSPFAGVAPVVVVSDEPEAAMSMVSSIQGVEAIRSPGSSDVEDIAVLSCSDRVVWNPGSTFSYLGILLGKSCGAENFRQVLMRDGTWSYFTRGMEVEDLK